MKNNASFAFSFFLVIGDFCSFLVAFIGAYVVRVSYGGRATFAQVPSRTYLALSLALIPLCLVIFALFGLYNRTVFEKRFRELGRLLLGSFIGLLFLTGIAYFSNKPIFPAKLVPVYAFIFTFLLLVIFRTIARIIRRSFFSHGRGITNVLIVGSTPATAELAGWLADPKQSGYKIIGIVSKQADKYPKISHYGSFAEALKHCEKKGIHSIMQTELYKDAAANDEILTYAQTNHVAYRFIPGNSELFVGNLDVELFQSSIPMIAVHQTSLIGWGRIAKRLFDVVVASLLLIVLGPLMLAMAVAIKLFGGRGPVFFRQQRLTRHNRKFRVFKFRSMMSGNSTPEEDFKKLGKPELIAEFRANGDFLEKDPRVTRIGHFMRATSIDELPQLFNVLKGDISLVGPRALIPQELELYAKRHTILSVKSGLTGLAQVSGRKHISFEERRKLDMYYVQNWTFWMDLTILAKTLRAIINSGGS